MTMLINNIIPTISVIPEQSPAQNQPGKNRYAHPTLKGWSLAWLPLLPLVRHVGTGHRQSLVGVIVTGGQTQMQLEHQKNRPGLAKTIVEQIEKLPDQTLVGIDFSGIANMDPGLWQALGPNLTDYVVSGKAGRAKRLLFMLGEHNWLANDLQWAFESAARTRLRAQPGAAHPNLAVLAPAAEHGYCGVLAPIYAETLELVNAAGSISSLELYQHLQRRYRLAPAHADQCLALLSQQGLLHRFSSTRTDGTITYDLNAKGYSLTVSEQTLREKGLELKVEPPPALG